MPPAYDDVVNKMLGLRLGIVVLEQLGFNGDYFTKLILDLKWTQ